MAQAVPTSYQVIEQRQITEPPAWLRSTTMEAAAASPHEAPLEPAAINPWESAGQQQPPHSPTAQAQSVQNEQSTPRLVASPPEHRPNNDFEI